MTPQTDPLAPIRARLEAATPGPWDNDGGGEVSQHWSRPEPWKQVVSRDVACMSYCYGGSAQGVCEDADAEFIAHAPADVARLLAALDAVMGLHEPRPHHLGPLYRDTCVECRRDWPCPTVRAVSAALGGGE